MMRVLNAIAAISIAVLSIGCVRTSHKLSEVGETVTDDEIVGVWELQHDSFFGPRVATEKDRMCIEARDDGRYQMRSLDSRDKVVSPFSLVKAEGTTFVEVNYYEMVCLAEPTLSEEDKKALANEPGMLFPYRWERRGEWMAVWTANRSKIDRYLNKGELVGQSMGGFIGVTGITSSAADLEAFIKNHGDEIYDSRQVYRRISKDVSTQAPEITGTH